VRLLLPGCQAEQLYAKVQTNLCRLEADCEAGCTQPETDTQTVAAMYMWAYEWFRIHAIDSAKHLPSACRTSDVQSSGILSLAGCSFNLWSIDSKGNGFASGMAPMPGARTVALWTVLDRSDNQHSIIQMHPMTVAFNHPLKVSRSVSCFIFERWPERRLSSWSMVLGVQEKTKGHPEEATHRHKPCVHCFRPSKQCS
jgi:hypothetical protein